MNLTETIVWIPVAERLPDDQRDVLVACGGVPHGSNCWYSAKYKRWSRTLDARIISAVRHWAELPKGPTP